MTLLLFAMPGNEELCRGLAKSLGAELGRCEIRRFPDGESFVRIDSDVRRRDLAIICTLDRPDEKFLPLVFLGATARELGATSVGLVAPYLAYMRQDKRFHAGEAVTSGCFAKKLSSDFDWLVTMDPHLHRRKGLSEIYPIGTAVAHAGTDIGDWIRTHVTNPIVVGPDSESEQWVSAVAARAKAPYLLLEKVRHGDRDVRVSTAHADKWLGHTPVLVDDIVSTARTMKAAAVQFRDAGFTEIIAIGVHALFADGAHDELKAVGVSRIITCNTVTHPSNAIDVTNTLAAAIRQLAQKAFITGENHGT